MKNKASHLSLILNGRMKTRKGEEFKKKIESY